MSSPAQESQIDPVVAKTEESSDEVSLRQEEPTENSTTPLNDDEEATHEDKLKEEPESIANDDDAPAAADEANSDEDELSDLDEEEVVANAEAAGTIPIDEEVYKLRRHKKQGARASASSALPKEKTREKKNKLTPADLGRVENDYADDDNDLASAPGATKGSNKKRRSKSDDIEDEIPDDQLDPEARRRREFERRIQATGVSTNKRRKKTNDDVLDQFQDEMVNNLREKMRTAAIEDAECVRNGTPAMSKLKLLPEVKDVLRKSSLADTILDNNLLEAVRIWLEPLPDASLPAYEIQKELFSALDRLPIKTIHLRESGLGKVVIFYQKSKRPQLNIKRTVDKLEASDCIYSSKRSAVVRASEDFMPREPTMQTLHVASVSFNSLLLGEIVKPDWDMFHSDHASAGFHAAARAVGGCGVYVSDKPGCHNFKILKKLVLPDGSVLRAKYAGRPTRECLFKDPVLDGKSLLKIWNLNKFSGVIGVFNCHGAGSWPMKDHCSPVANSLSISGHLSPLDIEYLEELAGENWTGDCAVFAFNSGYLSRVPKSGGLDVSLETLQCEIFTVSPIKAYDRKVQFAPLGLTDMYNSGGAIEYLESTTNSSGCTINIRSRGPGRFGAYSSMRPRHIKVDNKEEEFSFDPSDGLLIINLSYDSREKGLKEVEIVY